MKTISTVRCSVCFTFSRGKVPRQCHLLSFKQLIRLHWFRSRRTSEENSPTSATIFRRETIPIHSTMAENPHYEAHHFPSNNDSKEDRDQVSMPLLVLDRKPEYKVISSSCLHSLKDLGEGVFGKVHLSTYCSSEDLEAEKFLVAVSCFAPFLNNRNAKWHELPIGKELYK